jgi:hypothetical protein
LTGKCRATAVEDANLQRFGQRQVRQTRLTVTVRYLELCWSTVAGEDKVVSTASEEDGGKECEATKKGGKAVHGSL